MPRSSKTFTYHGRKGHPVIHGTGRKQFIMVRKTGGGTKRLPLTPRTRRQLESKRGVSR